MHITAETGIEPISSESESDVIPLHYSAITGRKGLEPLSLVLETNMLPLHQHPIYKGDGTRTHITGVKVLCTYHLYDTLSISRKDGELTPEKQSDGLFLVSSGQAMLGPDRSEARP